MCSMKLLKTINLMKKRSILNEHLEIFIERDDFFIFSLTDNKQINYSINGLKMSHFFKFSSSEEENLIIYLRATTAWLCSR